MKRQKYLNVRMKIIRKIIDYFRRYFDIKTDTGLWGEKEAEKHLKLEKYLIIGRRIRITRREEIDLIAEREKTLVFVEVKTRASENYGRPIDAVNKSKKHVLSRAMVRYLKKMKNYPEYIRFDVIEVIGTPGKGVPEIRHIENAFQLQKPYDLPY